MDKKRCSFVIVQARTTHFAVIDWKSKRLHQMQPNAGVRAETDNVPGIWRYLRRDQHNVEHGLALGFQSEAGWADACNHGRTDDLSAAAMDCANGFA